MKHKLIKNIIAYGLTGILVFQQLMVGGYHTEVISAVMDLNNLLCAVAPDNGSNIVGGKEPIDFKLDLDGDGYDGDDAYTYDDSGYTYSIVYSNFDTEDDVPDNSTLTSVWNSQKNIDFVDDVSYGIAVAVKKVSKTNALDVTYINGTSYVYSERLPEFSEVGVDTPQFEYVYDAIGIYTDAKLQDIDTSSADWSNHCEYSNEDVFYRWGLISVDEDICNNDTVRWLYSTDSDDTETVAYDNSSIVDEEDNGLTGRFLPCAQAYVKKAIGVSNKNVYSTIVKGNAVSFDNTAPAIKILKLTNGSSLQFITNKWYTNSVYYHLEMEDEGTYSAGIKKVVISSVDADGTSVEKYRYTYDGLNVDKTYEKDIVFDVDGCYNILIEAEDRVGNIYETYVIPNDTATPGRGTQPSDVDYSYKMDNVKPTVSFDTILEDEGVYNGSSYDLGVSAEDELSGIDTYNIVVKRDNTSYSYNDTNEYDFVTDIKFTEEGDYTLNAIVKDKAGNTAGEATGDSINERAKVSFAIDRTAPEVSILDENDYNLINESASNRKAYDEETTLTFKVKDKHNDFDKYKITIEKADNEDVIATDRQTTILLPETDEDINWQKSADGTDGTFSYDFQPNGVYYVTFYTMDKGGNVNSKSVVVIVDDKAPTTTITGVSYDPVKPDDIDCYGGDVTLNIHITDNICRNSVAKYEITRIYNKINRQYILEDLTTTSKNYTTTVNFNQEGIYTVKLIATDEAGNEASSNTVKFIIDKTTPRISISSDDVSSGGEIAGNVTLDFTHLDANDYYYNLTVVRKNDGHTYTNSNLYEDIEESVGWLDTDKNYEKEASYTFADEGVYEVTFKAEDKAHNKSDDEVYLFSIDRTAPVINAITYTNDLGNIGPKYTVNNIYSNKYITVRLNVTDNISGVKKINYCLADENGHIDRFTGNTYEAVLDGENMYSILIPGKFSIAEMNSKIGIWCEDNLGNVSRVTPSYNMIYNTAHSSITMTEDKDYSKWISDDVSFDVVVVDDKSGIDNIVYKVNDRIVKEITFNDIVKRYEYKVTATENAPTKDGYYVEVIVTSNTGTVTSDKRKVYIDKQAPVISVSGVNEGEHVASDKTLDFNIQETAFDECLGQVRATRSIDGFTTNYTVPDMTPSKVQDTIKRSFTEEGYYTVYFVVEDGAGNKATSNTVHFVVDKTAPQLTISGTTDKSVNKGEVTINLSCIESFYETNNVVVEVTKTIDGQTTNIAMSRFLSLAKESSLQHTFTDDGTYTITFNATDLAGNVSIVKTISFTIDKTAPELSFNGVTNYLVTNNTVSLSSNVIESYYQGNKITITGTRTDIKGKISNIGPIEFTTNSKEGSRLSTFSEEGIYYIHMVSHDEAGNESEAEINFTIDKSAPVISYMDTIDGQYFSIFSLSDIIDNIIEDLSVVKYNIYLNGIEYDGVTPVETDGKYSLYIDVVDEVGYESDAYAEFIVDHTAPKVIIDGVGDGDVTHNPGQVAFSLVDQEDTIDSIVINGTEVELEKGSKTYTLLYDTYGTYEVEITCSDKANNISNTVVKFRYTNVFTSAFIIVALVLFILFAGIILYLITKRKYKGWD